MFRVCLSFSIVDVAIVFVYFQSSAFDIWFAFDVPLRSEEDTCEKLVFFWPVPKLHVCNFGKFFANNLKRNNMEQLARHLPYLGRFEVSTF